VPFLNGGDMVGSSPLAGWKGRFFHSQNMTFAQWTITADATPLHEHHHAEEEVWNVVEGELMLSIGGIERRLGAGDAAVVPPNTPHSARAVTACRAIVTDFPLRQQLPGVGPHD
jgi:mannose-6-phosphate isomerase-like protein (cupin superfamily)